MVAHHALSRTTASSRRAVPPPAHVAVRLVACFAVALVLVVTAPLTAASFGAMPLTAMPLDVDDALAPDEPFDPVAARCDSAAPAFELWQHPVDAPVIDGFRPPSNPYGPGNRGLEYDTAPGDLVSAVTSGVVTFAGPVGGRVFIVARDASGLRVTYSYLERSDVEVGDTVSRGDPIATADTGMHLTVRDGDSYIDPLPLMADYRCFTVRLVPLPADASRLRVIG